MGLDFDLIEDGECVASHNITNNLNTMAMAAGIYEVLWRPDEHGYKTASDIIVKLEAGLASMKEFPDHYSQYDAENKWGTYKQFVPWVEQVLADCKAHPNATIEVDR